MDAVALPTNTGSNLRTLFWPAGAPVVADSQSCAVWSAQSSALVQQGASLRIRPSSTGRVRAITLQRHAHPDRHDDLDHDDHLVYDHGHHVHDLPPVGPHDLDRDDESAHRRPGLHVDDHDVDGNRHPNALAGS